MRHTLFISYKLKFGSGSMFSFVYHLTENFSFSAVFLDLNCVVLCFRYISQIHNGHIFQLIKNIWVGGIYFWTELSIKRNATVVCSFWSRLKFCPRFCRIMAIVREPFEQFMMNTFFGNRFVHLFILTREPIPCFPRG